jgi:elongation factor G
MKAKPVLLEPIVNMEVTVPEDKMGAITGEFVREAAAEFRAPTSSPGAMAQVKAQAPLSEVMQYQSQLMSVTGGQGSFFNGAKATYDPVAPASAGRRSPAQYKPKAEDE